MIFTKAEVVEKPSHYRCDRCGREAEVRGLDGEAQEFIHIDQRGAYASVIGDGCTITLDLCQHCLVETLGPWLRVTPSVY